MRDEEQSGEWWWGFACKGCGAPLAVEKTVGGKRTSARSLASWRIQCSCGHATLYGPRDRTVKILKVG